MVEERYPSKRLDCWERGKELVQEYFQSVAQARERGKLLVSGSVLTPGPLIAGVNGIALFSEPYAAAAASDPEFSRETSEAVEARGFARDICAYTRIYWGSVFLDRYYYGGPFPRPDFCFTGNHCEAGHARAHRLVAQHFGAPFFAFDIPVGPSTRQEQPAVEFLAAQLYDCIDWMERVTHRKYDDEAFIEALHHYFASEVLWGEICLLNRAIPAPIELKSLVSLMPVCMLQAHHREGVEFLTQLRDELQDRIDNQIAAVATERFRLMIDNMPPWPALEVLRQAQRNYGAVFLGAWIYTVTNCMLEYRDAWAVAPARTPEQQGISISNREEAVRALATWTVRKPIQRWYFAPEKEAMQMALARHWRVDGVILHYNRGCMAACLNIPQVKTSLEREGIPTTSFEGSCGDIRDIDLRQVADALDAFMERLGGK